MSSKNSQCETFIPLLDALVDNELTDSEKEQVSIHVQACDDCQRQVMEIEALKVSLAKLPQRKMRVDLADSFDFSVGKTSDATSGQAASATQATPSNAAPAAASNVVLFKRKWVVAAASAAAVAVIAIAGSFVTKGGRQQVAGTLDSSKTPSIAAQHHDGVQPEKKNENAIPEVANNMNAHSNKQPNHPAANLNAPTQSPEKIAANDGGQPLVKINDRSEKKEPSIANSASGVNAAPDSNSKMAVVAHDESAVGKGQSNHGSSELLALYEEDDSSISDIGVSTDEDGLYAIKL